MQQYANESVAGLHFSFPVDSSLDAYCSFYFFVNFVTISPKKFLNFFSTYWSWWMPKNIVSVKTSLDINMFLISLKHIYYNDKCLTFAKVYLNNKKPIIFIRSIWLSYCCFWILLRKDNGRAKITSSKSLVGKYFQRQYWGKFWVNIWILISK